MNTTSALNVTIHVSEGESHRGIPVSSAILNFLFYRGVRGAIVTKGVAGFGADHRLHSTSFVELSDHLPLKIEFTETPAAVEELIPRLQEMIGDRGTIEMRETSIIGASAASTLAHRHTRLEGKARLLRIYIGESDRWNGQPLHEALVDAMRSNDISGVTVYRGILGYGVKREIHKEKAFRLSSDLPIMLSVIDTAEKIEQLMPLLDRMIEQGLVVLSNADVLTYSYRAPETPQGS